MARIPTADELGIQTPGAVPRGARMPEISADLSSFSTEVAQAGLKDMQDRLERKELADAETQFQLAAIQEAEKLANDKDFETHAERHEAGMMEQLGKASMNITRGDLREQFTQRAQQQMIDLNYQVGQAAKKKAIDRDRGYLATTLSDIARGAADLEYGDPEAAAAASLMAVESAFERGIIDETDKNNMQRKSLEDIAIGRLANMSPMQQLAALDEDWVENLHPAKLRELKLKANEAMENEVAQDFAFSLANEQSERERNGEPELSQFDINMAIYNHFKDVPNSAGLIDRARTQYNSLYQTKLASDTQTALDSYNAVDLEVRTTEPPPTVAQLLDENGPYFEHIENMGPAQRQNVTNLVKAKAEGVTLKYSDRATLYQLRQLYAAGPDKRREAIQYFLDNSAKLNQTDWKQWNKELVQGEPSSLFNHQQVLQQMTERMPPAKQADIYRGMTDWYLDYQELKGAEPTDREVMDKINQAIKGVQQETLWGLVKYDEFPHSADLDERVNTYARAMQTSPEAAEASLAPYSESEKTQIRLGNLKRIDPDMFDDIWQQYQAAGVEINFLNDNYSLFERDFRVQVDKKSKGLIQ